MTTYEITKPTAARHPRAASFRWLVAAEWTKMRSLRSTRWSLALLVLASVGLTAVGSAAVAANWASLSAAQRHPYLANPTGFFGVAISLAQVPLCVLGVLVVTGEYSGGTIRTSVLAVPGRTRLALAKIAVFSAVSLLVGEAVAFPSLLLAHVLLPKALPVSLAAPGVLRATIGVGLYLWALGLASLAIGLLVRHTAAAITVVVGLVLVASGFAEDVPGSVGQHIGAVLPADAAKLIMAAHGNTGGLLSPWQGFAVACAWVAVLTVAGVYLFARRDA